MTLASRSLVLTSHDSNLSGLGFHRLHFCDFEYHQLQVDAVSQLPLHRPGDEAGQWRTEATLQCGPPVAVDWLLSVSLVQDGSS